MRCAQSFACGLAVVLGAALVVDAEAGGGRRAASGRLIELPLLFAAPDDGDVVLIAAPEIGATGLSFRGDVVVVPVAGKYLLARGPFGISAGTDRLTITMGERLSDFDSPFFVTAVFLPADRESVPYVIAAPQWVPFLTRGDFLVPDQEDSPALTHPGRGFRVLAGRPDDEPAPALPARRNGRRGR